MIIDKDKITAIFFNCTDAARLLEDPILNLRPGIKYPITCRQTTGQSGSDYVTPPAMTPPVFAVRNGLDSPIEVISAETAGYDIAAGKLNKSGITFQRFYLIIKEVTLGDNNKQFICVDNENEITTEAFLGGHTTKIAVSSAEGKFLGSKLFCLHLR